MHRRKNNSKILYTALITGMVATMTETAAVAGPGSVSAATMAGANKTGSDIAAAPPALLSEARNLKPQGTTPEILHSIQDDRRSKDNGKQNNPLPAVPALFGQHYTAALSYLRTNPWIADSLHRYGIDTAAGIAVIFPELLRYSALQDYFETASLRMLYVRFGTPYANFSIGRFQMKPSFAETVERQWMARPPAQRFGFRFDTTATVAARKQRLQRLCKTEGQVRYLIMFIHLAAIRLPELSTLTKDDGLRLLATAYNYSCTAPFGELLRHSRRTLFTTELWPDPKRSHYYNYADISLFYYNLCRQPEQTVTRHNDYSSLK